MLNIAKRKVRIKRYVGIGVWLHQNVVYRPSQKYLGSFAYSVWPKTAMCLFYTNALSFLPGERYLPDPFVNSVIRPLTH